MSTPEPCVTGVTLSDPTLCATLNKARTDPLGGPTIEPPTPIADDLMPQYLQQAMTDCTGSSTCRMIGYDFDTDIATKVMDSSYLVDTYYSTPVNAGVLVFKGKKTTGRITDVTTTANGGSTGTVNFTSDDNQNRSFSETWPTVQTNNATVDVYYDPVSKTGYLTPDELGYKPTVLIQPPGYELPDFQSAPITGTNKISSPSVATVDECASQCDTTTGCEGFNFGKIGTTATCDLVRDARTGRVYTDNMSGFRKSSKPASNFRLNSAITSSQYDFGNQGLYCQNATACNNDIVRFMDDMQLTLGLYGMPVSGPAWGGGVIIVSGSGLGSGLGSGSGSGSGSTSPNLTFSTLDIRSCEFCPERQFNYDNGNWTVRNEVGKLTQTGSKARAIAALQYSTDGTFASHITIQSGRFYKIGNERVVFVIAENDAFKLFSFGRTPSGYEVPFFGYLHSNFEQVTVYNSSQIHLILQKDSNGNYVTIHDNDGNPSTLNKAEELENRMNPRNATYDLFTFVPVDYVTDGFRIVNSAGKAMSDKFTASNFTRYDGNTVHIVSETTLDEFLTLTVPNYPKILFDGLNYIKVNGNTAQFGVNSPPYTSQYSGEVYFCLAYSSISLYSFDWTKNWFTQQVPADCATSIKIVRNYKAGLTVPRSFVPGFWNSLFCENPATPYKYNKQCLAACPSEAPFWTYDPYYVERPCMASCPSNLPLIETGNQCVSECGYLFRDGNTCLASCPNTKPYAVAISGSSNYNCATSCPATAPYNVPSYYNSCTSSCANGPGTLYLSGTTCVTSCPVSTPYIQGGACVSACSGTTPYYDPTDKICISSCPSSKPYLDGNRCSSSCPLTDPVAKTCVTSCPSARPFTVKSVLQGNYCAVDCTGFYRESSTSYNCVATCPIGSPPTNGVCTTCQTGYYSQSRTMACTQCLAGYFCPDAGTINTCSAGSYCPAGSTSQNACQAGYYCSTPSSQTQCSPGYSCPAGSTTQTACTFTPANGLKWANPGVDCSMTSCTTSGSYCTGGTESVCTAACSGENYQTTACTSTTNRVCTPCTAACSGENYQTTACTSTTNRVCSPCTAACSGENYQTTACTSTTNRVCSPCTAACTAGNYQTTACTSTTNRVCSTCPAGSYCTGGTSINTCTSGNYCPAGSSSQTACTGSPTGGFYCPTTSTKYDCTPCQAGYYASSPCNSTTNTVCSQCMQGQNDGSVSCPGGYNSSCPMDCNLSVLQQAAKDYYYNTYWKKAYQITSIDKVEKRDEQYCRYYYTWKKVSDGSTGTDVRLWRFSNPYSYCTTSKLPVLGIYANQ